MTLRDAISEMDKSTDPTNIISFNSNVIGNIQLQAELPPLSKNITIDGPGVTVLSVLGSGPGGPKFFGVFNILTNTTCEINKLTISNGDVSDSGGGIYNSGNLTLVDVDVTSNYANSSGGGIFNATGAQLTLYSTIVASNGTMHNGAGIANEGELQVLEGSQIGGNDAGGEGDGLFNAGNAFATIEDNAQIYYNQASTGGGVYMSGGTVSMSGGTVYGNTATNGGGLYVNAGNLTLTAGVVINGNGNGATNGAGMYINGGTVTMSGGSIENNNVSGDGGGICNIAGNLTLQGGVTIGPNNQANNGGGLYLGKNSTTTFNGCTISGNEANNLGVGYYEEYGARINPLAINNPDQFYAEPPP